MNEVANSGQGTTPTAPVDNGQLIADIQAKLSEAETTITRLRGTQSANDRTIGELKSQTSKLGDYEAQIKALEIERDTATQATVELTQKVQAVGTLTTELESLKERNNRLMIAASKASQSPIIAALIENNALPQADTVEDFTTALDSIIGRAGTQAANQAKEMLSGSRPVPNSAGDAESPIEMIRRGEQMVRDKKIDEGIALIQEGERLKARA